MNTKTLLTSLALTALLAACGTGSTTPTTGPYGDKDSAWFQTHQLERQVQVNWCNLQAGQGVLTGLTRQVCGVAYNSPSKADAVTKIKADQKAAATQFYKPFPTYH